MKKNNTLEEIWEKIKESKKVLLTLHTGPDGDSLGSCAAMKYALEKLGKQVTLISHDNLSEILQSIKFSNEVEFGKDVTDIDLSQYDTFICADIATTEMIGKFKKDYNIPKSITSINLDHHSTNEYFAQLNYVDTTKASACSVLIDLFKAANFEIDGELATRILLGVYTDSGIFSHNVDAIKEAAFLVEKGADYQKEIVYKIKYNIPLRLKKYHGLLLSKFKVIEIGKTKVGYSVTALEDTEKLKLNIAEIREGVSKIQDTKGIDLFFTLAETKEYIKGSFRTRTDIDVSALAKSLGGGGHKQTAAFRLENMTLEQAEKKVLDTIKQLL